MKWDKPKDNRPNKTLILKSSKLPIFEDDNNSCNFYGYDVESLMKETSELRNIIPKRGTLYILIPPCCFTDPVRYVGFKISMKGIGSKTLTIRLKELWKTDILNKNPLTRFLRK